MEKLKLFVVFLMVCFLFIHSTVPILAIDTAPAPTTDTAPVDEMTAPPADETGPTFISVSATSSSETEANVVWTTDELAYGYVEYGTTSSYGQKTPKSSSAAMDHTVSITNLTPGTIYHYRIVAEDESGNVSYSKDRSLETAFEVVAMDNVPPEISQIDTSGVTQSAATIHWVTDEVAQGKVEYGKTSSYGLATSFSIDYAAEHSVTLSNLDPDTQYHFRVVAQDESGNEASSFDEIFITDEAAIQEPAPTPEPEDTQTSTPPPANETPVPPAFAIYHVETSSLKTTGATIIWKTNELANAQVFYSKGQSYELFSAVSTANSTSHEIMLTNLTPATNYFYKVVSKNASGQTINKSGFEFNTLVKQKVIAVAPTILNVKVESISESAATILFNTDLPAAGIVNYGTTTGYEETDGGHTALLTSHTHPLSNLSPDTLYHFEIAVQDSLGNETIYGNTTFKTLAGSLVKKLPTVSPEGEDSGGFYYTPSENPVPRPVITKVEALDKQVIFLWRPASKESGLKTIIVRQDNSYTKSLLKGDILYQGNSGRFVDINLENGKTYHYSVFRVNKAGHYAFGMHFSLVPREAKTQTKIIAVPPVVQKSPIYAFTNVLSVGDTGKDVEHLQILLASEPSLYPEGKITGYFGQLTKKAVMLFQKRHGLSATGVADKATLRQIESLSSIEIVKDKAEYYNVSLARDLQIGSRGKDVSVLQEFLINYGVYPEALITGYFGNFTKTALQKFQTEQNIKPAFGYFGQKTKQRMLNLIRLRSVSL